MSGFEVAAVWVVPVIVLLAVTFHRMAAASRRGAARACAVGIGAVLVLGAASMVVAGLFREQPNPLMVVFGAGLGCAGILVSSVYWRSVR